MLAKGLEAIYKGLNVRDEIEDHIFRETLRLFNEAAAKGFADSDWPEDVPDEFINQIRTNNKIWAAFRTHRMQNDLAAQLIGKDGQLKKFDRWVEDIKGMTNHYVGPWLRTEYSTAVLRAHQAADWKHFEAEQDVFPNLRWMPTTSPNQDPLHRQYWESKLTLPINHPFWEEHRPGDRWNCKCTLEQTDEDVNDKVIQDFYPVPMQPGLDNNPAKDGKLFNDTHPYFKSNCKVCPFYGKKSPVNRLVGFFNAGKDCYNCAGANLAITQSQHNAIVAERAKAVQNYSPSEPEHKLLANLKTKEMLISKKPLNRLLNHCRTVDDIEAAVYIWTHPEKLSYIKPSHLGEHKDMTDPKSQKNIQRKKERGVVMYQTYEFDYKGSTWIVKLEEHKKGFEQFYFLKKKQNS